MADAGKDSPLLSSAPTSGRGTTLTQTTRPRSSRWSADLASGLGELLDAPTATKAALRALQIGVCAVVLAGLSQPYDLFVLDRHAVPKELVLLVTALAAGLLTLAAARRLGFALVDLLLIAFLAISLFSFVLGSNHWLAFRALGLSLASAAVFWSARAVARAGGRRELLVVLAAAATLAAATALVQAYGLATPTVASLSRAPGGTFGNRNFMAHFVAIGLPLVLLGTLEARSRTGAVVGTVAVLLMAMALVLSRSRAAWLGGLASTAFLAVEGFWIGRLWWDEAIRRRTLVLGIAALVGLIAALLLPNRLRWKSDSPYLDSLVGVANYKEGSGRGRMIQYRNSLRMAADHPLVGVGPGNWSVRYPQYMSENDPSFDADDFIPTNPWPSSDWMATAAERGFVALVLLLLVGGTTALGAWARIRGRGRPQPEDLTLVGTLIAASVVGSFDAVLILPAPSLFVWATVGALATTAKPVRTVTLDDRLRRHLLVAAAAVGAVFLLRALLQLGSMALFLSESRATREWATRLDPGSYRMHVLLADESIGRRDCKRGVPHARAAQALFPHHPAPKALLRSCSAR